MNMVKSRILTVLMILFMCSPALAVDNPFNKGVKVKIGSNNKWQIKGKTATRSGSYSGDFYHFSYDRKHLRLRITSGAEDSEATAREYQKLAVEDVQIDGKRLPLFQWCLANQQKHTRFLQQGLKVKQGVCANEGKKGTFVMRLNAATLEALNKGQTLSFMIKPFRSSITVNFDISDFSGVMAKLSSKEKSVKTVSDKVVVVEMCKESPPKGFAKIKSIEYSCKDATAKAKAKASIKAMLVKERKWGKTEATKKQAVTKAAKEALAAEQAALAETEASKQEMNNEITNKMLAVCMKKWASGEHRCYCEKFIKHAPVGIESDPSCAAL